MLKLAINTATTINNIALLSDLEVLAEESWVSHRNQAEVLQPKIKALLEKNKFQWTDITQVIVVKGPGAFTSLRVGVVSANTIAFSLKKPIAGISTFDIFKERLKTKKEACTSACWLFLSAGKDKAYFLSALEDTKKEGEIFPLSEITSIIKEKNITMIYGDISEHQADFLTQNCEKLNIIKEEELSSFADSILTTDIKNLNYTNQIEPHYIQQANITMPCST